MPVTKPDTFSKVTFDHLGISVPATLFEAEIAFYQTALAPLGIKQHFRIIPLVAALGSEPAKPDFWVSAVRDGVEIVGDVSRVHFAFRAEDREQVDEFWRLGVEAGGKDGGKPGIREVYHKGYYAAFVTSPAGHGVEVVFHDWDLAG